MRTKLKDKSKLQSLYLQEQKSLKELAVIFEVNPKTIKKWLIRCGVPLRSKSDSFKIAYKHGIRRRAFGSMNPRWVGERTTHQGYVFVYYPGHPRANKRNRVLEHILVWEKVHGKILPRGWSIHHINGIKNDNRPDNLAALPDRTHIRLIPIYRQRIRQLEEQIKQIQAAYHLF